MITRDGTEESLGNTSRLYSWRKGTFRSVCVRNEMTLIDSKRILLPDGSAVRGVKFLSRRNCLTVRRTAYQRSGSDSDAATTQRPRRTSGRFQNSWKMELAINFGMTILAPDDYVAFC